MKDHPERDDEIAAVYIDGGSVAEVFRRAADWAARYDGAMELRAVHWNENLHVDTHQEPRFELHIFFGPQ